MQGIYERNLFDKEDCDDFKNNVDKEDSGSFVWSDCRYGKRSNASNKHWLVKFKPVDQTQFTAVNQDTRGVGRCHFLYMHEVVVAGKMEDGNLEVRMATPVTPAHKSRRTFTASDHGSSLDIELDTPSRPATAHDPSGWRSRSLTAPNFTVNITSPRGNET